MRTEIVMFIITITSTKPNLLFSISDNLEQCGGHKSTYSDSEDESGGKLTCLQICWLQLQFKQILDKI